MIYIIGPQHVGRLLAELYGCHFFVFPAVDTLFRVDIFVESDKTARFFDSLAHTEHIRIREYFPVWNSIF